MSLYAIDLGFFLIGTKERKHVPARESKFHEDMICKIGVEELDCPHRALTSTPLSTFRISF